MDAYAIHAELDRVRDDFRALLEGAGAEELRRRSEGTRWTNEQLLFHMLFGYLLVHRLLPLVRVVSRLPEGLRRGFAATLDAVTRPFHVVNYLGSLGGARVLGRPRMARLLDRQVRFLHRVVGDGSDPALARWMCFPAGWDPYFRDRMDLLDVVHYATQHYVHHRRQLTLAAARAHAWPLPPSGGAGDGGEWAGPTTTEGTKWTSPR